MTPLELEQLFTWEPREAHFARCLRYSDTWLVVLPLLDHYSYSVMGRHCPDPNSYSPYGKRSMQQASVTKVSAGTASASGPLPQQPGQA